MHPLSVSEKEEFQPSQRHTIRCGTVVVIFSGMTQHLEQPFPELCMWDFFFFFKWNLPFLLFYSHQFLGRVFPTYLCACVHMTSIRWIKSNALIPSQTRPLHHKRSEIPGVRKRIPLRVIQGDGKPRNSRIHFPKLLFAQSPKNISCERMNWLNWLAISFYQAQSWIGLHEQWLKWATKISEGKYA